LVCCSAFYREDKRPAGSALVSWVGRFRQTKRLVRLIQILLTGKQAMSKSSIEDLKKREATVKALVYVSGGFILLTMGYNIALLVFQKIHSLSELIGRSVFSLGGFGASFLISAYVLKKTKAEISLRKSQETDN